ncbi:hypothetical protein BGX38DRAFT_1223249 [Terfezia claveryi]|nr:hypothetical protein BGX38DRAFT_1223249 [Terfezia claveryi]
MHGEKAKLLRGYRLSLLDWGRGRNKKKSEEQCKRQCSKSGRGSEDDGTGSGMTDPGQKSTATSIRANNNVTAKSITDCSPQEDNSSNDSSPPIHPNPRNRKGKSPLSRRSSSSGLNSDVASTSSSSSSSSFSYGPPEFEDAKSKEEEVIIPDSGVFKSTRLAQVPVTELMKQLIKERDATMDAFIPTVAQCAAHLELLGCFSKLRAKVEASEEIGRWLFGKEYDAEGASDAGDIKWRAFVGKAVERFHMWWINFPEVVKNLPEPVDYGKYGPLSLNEKLESRKQAGFLRQWKRKPAKPGVMDIFTELEKNAFGSGISFRKMTAETLPPLDVLLVWHAYTLNPHAFYEDCIRLNRLELWGMPFPWDLIHNAIDNYDFAFSLPSTAATFFMTITGQSADLYQSLVGASEKPRNSSIDNLRESPQKELYCPWCEKPFNVPLAEWHKAGDVGDYGGACRNCEKVYEKEVVSVSMFLRDVHQYFLIEKEKEKEKNVEGVSNRDGISKTPKSMFRHLSNHTQLANNSDDASSPIPLLTRIITNIITTYQYLPPPTTSIPASTDLGAAVLRQGVFIKKIHDDARHIRSPALAGTIRRARGRYDKFFRLIGKYRGKIFVPTNEIDLVWHTQQCYPALYYLYSNMVTASAGAGGGGRYVDHNDRLGEGILGNGFEETKRIWRVEYRKARGEMGEGEIPLGQGRRWWVLSGRKLRGMKSESDQIDMTRAASGESAVGGEGEKSNSENEGDVENSSIAAITSATPTMQQDLGKDKSPSSPPAEDPEYWDEDGKYAICCCWNCEMRRDMQEKAGRGKYWKWGTGKGKGDVGFTRKDEWKLRATVHYYRAVEAARNEGKRLPVWNVREPWVE